MGFAIDDEEKARVHCPFADLHTTPTTAGSCVIFNNGGALRAFCFHQSCREPLDAINRKLFGLTCGQTAPGGAHFSAVDRTHEAAHRSAWLRKQRERQELEREAAAMFSDIQKERHWPAAAIKADSLEGILPSVNDHYYHVLSLFDDDDVLWCADAITHTGKSWSNKRFRRSSKWFQSGSHPGAFTCPSTFQPGSISRCKASVASRKFLVVESDKLDRNQVGAVFRWLETKAKLRLRAVVDTGNRSLHGWFEYPAPVLLERLKIILPVFGCDPAMFGASQPCRMPGVIRPETGRFQELIYVAPPSSSPATSGA